MVTQKQLRVLMIVENCPFLRDPRVQKEATSLHSAGHQVSVICPKAFPAQPWRESINGIKVCRYRPMPAGLRAVGYSIEYAYATLAIALLSLIVLMREGSDVIHVANPPDTLVLTVAPYKLIGKRIIYDQHDLCPELLTTKFDKLR
ncbi:MAG: glycosyltransferase [Candidatus Sulfotelmatobacter sp.]